MSRESLAPEEACLVDLDPHEISSVQRVGPGVFTVSTATLPGTAPETKSQTGHLSSRLMEVVNRILRIHEASPSDWQAVLGLRAGWSATELNNVKRSFLLTLHPDKAFSVVESAHEQARIRRAFDVMTQAHAAAKHFLQHPAERAELDASLQDADRALKSPNFFDRCLLGHGWGLLRLRPPSQPLPSAARSSSPFLHERCAHPVYIFSVTVPEFGSFCCKRCHLACTDGRAPEHGHLCEQMDGQHEARAAECPPHQPMRPTAGC